MFGPLRHRDPLAIESVLGPAAAACTSMLDRSPGVHAASVPVPRSVLPHGIQV
jgi:hypothetical protein